ncbi:lysozyme, partial [Burkholderia gladioli]
VTTAVDLITLALKDIGALGVGQPISPEDTMDALATLNMMLGQWQGERLSVYHLVDTAIQSTGAQSYTVGMGGDANLEAAAELVDRAVTVALAPHEKAAMVSIMNNVGPGRARAASDSGHDGIVVLANGEPSTLLRMLNAGARLAAADQFLVWNRAGGVVSDGLKRRRAAERDLFLTGEWS